MKVTVFGAGAIGCFIGGSLAQAGIQVTLIGRARLQDQINAHGLRLTDYNGRDDVARDVHFETTADAVAGADLVLVCVKSRDTEDAARLIRPHLDADTEVISFQNGVGNAEVLAHGLGRTVIPGMVGFNVAMPSPGCFHKGTKGDLHVADALALRDVILPFVTAGLPLIAHPDMRPVLWAKLMLNLNNAVNALANIPLREQLLQRDFRECVALAQSEFLSVAKAAGLPRLARLTPLPAAVLPMILRLPTPAFRLAAASMMRLDSRAQSSMADDLALNRPTEVDWINGEVVALAQSAARSAPVNARLCTLVHQAENADHRPTWTASALLAELRTAAGLSTAS